MSFFRAQWDTKVAQRLSPERLAHSRRVADWAMHLAMRHGADRDAAVAGGLLHDWAKELPASALIAEAQRLHVGSSWPLPTLHAVVGAAQLAELGLAESACAAVKWHTTGCPNMTLESAIVFVADASEPARDFPGVLEIRRLAEVDIGQACLVYIDGLLKYLTAVQAQIHPKTQETYEWLRQAQARGGFVKEA